MSLTSGTRLGPFEMRELRQAGDCAKKSLGGRKMKNQHQTRIGLMDSGLSSAQFRF
jgi:hypothetical protein